MYRKIEREHFGKAADKICRALSSRQKSLVLIAPVFIFGKLYDLFVLSANSYAAHSFGSKKKDKMFSVQKRVRLSEECNHLNLARRKLRRNRKTNKKVKIYVALGNQSLCVFCRKVWDDVKLPSTCSSSHFYFKFPTIEMSFLFVCLVPVTNCV